ncbi:MAG: response regulator [Myxococcota bacterium]|nr:response regulator [Myxococcota bacterium]
MTDLSDPRLRVLVVAPEGPHDDGRDAHFVAEVLEERGDSVEVFSKIPDALERLARGDVDLALISLSLPRGDGLALVHHLRALHPLVDVIVLVTPNDLEDAAHAMALGVLQTVMRPLTGDALLVAVDRARERRILLEQRRRLGAEARWGKMRSATYSRCAAFVAETDARVVGERILQTCAEEVALAAGALYAPPFPGAGTYQRAAVVAGGDELPPALDDAAIARLDPTQPVQIEDAIVRVLFLGHDDLDACAVLVPEEPLTDEQREALTIVASLGTAALTAARKVDAIARTGLKDPETSAYTFAYFGDVAGREIDRAQRHGRRFALMTLALDGQEDLARLAPPDVRLQVRRLVTDAVLSAIRDSDVLARVARGWRTTSSTCSCPRRGCSARSRRGAASRRASTHCAWKVARSCRCSRTRPSTSSRSSSCQASRSIHKTAPTSGACSAPRVDARNNRVTARGGGSGSAGSRSATRSIVCCSRIRRATC